MRSRWHSAPAAAGAAALAGLLAACTSSASGRANATVQPTGGASGSGSVSASVSGTPSASVSGSATLTGGHCTLYTRSQAAPLIGRPNATTGLPQITASGGTRVDTCMYSNVDLVARSGKMLGYGAVKYSNNADAAAAARAAVSKAESAASSTPREFPAPGVPAGTRDGVWQRKGSSGIPSITVAVVVSNVGRYLVWADGGGTVGTQRAEQIALTVARQLVSKAGG